jgi:PiT family inorganic phosphate transporter
LLLLSKALIRDRRLYVEPHGSQPPPFWIRSILFATCTGVSFAHGSNDGQKGVGLIMLILIGILPAQYAINTHLDSEQLVKTAGSIQQVENVVSQFRMDPAAVSACKELERIQAGLSSAEVMKGRSAQERSDLRASILRADEQLGEFERGHRASLSTMEFAILKEGRLQLRKLVDFVATWVVFAVALALGIGTTVGWKRIVVTVGEKIGKTHLTYAQGASAELVAMSTIAAADLLGMPVSTTHVLSSGVAGAMAANQSGLQLKTVRAIATAWVLTLPVTMLLSGTLFSLTAGSSMKEIGKRAIVQPRPERVVPQLQ